MFSADLLDESLRKYHTQGYLSLPLPLPLPLARIHSPHPGPACRYTTGQNLYRSHWMQKLAAFKVRPHATCQSSNKTTILPTEVPPIGRTPHPSSFQLTCEANMRGLERQLAALRKMSEAGRSMTVRYMCSIFGFNSNPPSLPLFAMKVLEQFCALADTNGNIGEAVGRLGATSSRNQKRYNTSAKLMRMPSRKRGIRC